MPHTTDFIAPETAATLAGLFRERVRRTPQAGAYQRYSEKEDRFETVTWQEAYRLAGRWQAAFEQQGLQPGDRVAIMLRNCLEWILFDLAALGFGLVTVPLFVEDRPSNVRHILTESGARLILAPDRKRWLRIEESVGRMPTVGKIVTLDPDAWEKDFKAAGDAGNRKPEAAQRTDISELAAWLPEACAPYAERRRDPKALATIVYTSGTTGLPKGVMLSHENILENAFACLKRVPVYREDLFLSFLPLSHTFERTVGHYIPMMAGACVAYVRSIDKLSEDFLKVRPTVLISVPRIYERAYAKIESGLENKSPIARALFRFTVDRGWRRFLHRQGRNRWQPCFLLWPLLEKFIAHHVTRAFGGRLRLSISGGAPIGLSVARVFIGLGLNFLQGYGLTETSPVISVNTADSNDPATVGRPLPGVETRIAGNGELLVRGPTVMSGYWRDQEATDAVIDSEGYFHTGDIAEMDARGRLKIVGRLKEIIVLSTGEKVPPGDLELAITENLLFEQAMIVGEGRPYLAALVVLNRKEWEKTAAAAGLPPDQAASLSGEAVESILLSEMARMIHRFPGYAQIRRVHATFHPWRMEDGLITNTLKLRRNKLLERFGREVDALFKGH
jgi:long-chain acyl-CoA synthetase